MEKGVWMYLQLFLIIFNYNYILVYSILEPKFRTPRAAPGTPPDGGGIDITESLTQEAINSNNMPLPVVPVLRPPQVGDLHHPFQILQVYKHRLLLSMQPVLQALQ
uniref:Uncharacterized protein n=1 Tax=Meloidogyne enterolobii TaxID=390850 RepID=A0A6V7XAY7_MELEN|nr:unnamed protein product [Meloidogyne enterolobii]